MESKLYRSRTDQMIAGVAGGLGNFLGIDSTWVRLFFVLMLFFHGVGFWVYLVLAIVVPLAPEGEEDVFTSTPWMENPQAVKVVGGALLVFGLVALVDNLNIQWLDWVNFRNLWPALLILGGGAMLWRSTSGKDRYNE